MQEVNQAARERKGKWAPKEIWVQGVNRVLMESQGHRVCQVKEEHQVLQDFRAHQGNQVSLETMV